VQQSQERVEAARRALDRQADRDEAQRLSVRLANIDAARAELARTQQELAPIVLTDALMREIEKAASAVERAAGQAELASAHIELVAADDVEVRVDGESVVLSAGSVWSTNTSTTTDIDVPGVVTARVVPGTPASDTQATLDAAEEALAQLLSTADVDDIVGARLLDQRRRELAAARDRSTGTLTGLLGGDDDDALRARFAELCDTASNGADAAGPGDAARARTELTEATAAQQKAIADCETYRKVAVVASKRLGEKATQASVAQEKLTACLAELTVGRQRLAEQRATATDDALLVRSEADMEKARKATGLVAELRDELAGCAPDTVAAALDEALHRVDALSTRHDETADALRLVTAQLKVYGTEGRKCQLDAAETEREHAEAQYLRVHRRARAAELLRSVMARHRDATRLRYVDPFRGQVERLGRLVFGDTFEVEVDSKLRICSRTLSGRTVPYESLSGGAKEQLGIVARLAGAALVAKEDSVPVVIDDALGFTDPERLVKMGAVFDAVGGDGQVIVLTCSPQRYQSVGAAHHIELSA
jgi:hypothetical protein